VAVDKKKAALLFYTGTQKGDSYARSELYSIGHSERLYIADCLYYGKELKADRQQAVIWYEKAAKLGNVIARRRLGDCYANGDGVGKDIVKAMDHYREAITKNDVEAARSYFRILSNATKADRMLLERIGHNVNVVPPDLAEKAGFAPDNRTPTFLREYFQNFPKRRFKK
jgi:TPR repeat protein